jgi:hypothetical protein
MLETKQHRRRPRSKVRYFSDLSRLRLFLKLPFYGHVTSPGQRCQICDANTWGRKGGKHQRTPAGIAHPEPPRRLNTNSRLAPLRYCVVKVFIELVTPSLLPRGSTESTAQNLKLTWQATRAVTYSHTKVAIAAC